MLQQPTTKNILISNIKEFEVYKRAYAISFCANLGEGYAKQNYSKAEFKRFVLIAISSCNKIIIWSDYCKDLGYINYEIWNNWNLEYQQILRMLNSFKIKNLNI